MCTLEPSDRTVDPGSYYIQAGLGDLAVTLDSSSLARFGQDLGIHSWASLEDHHLEA